MEGIKMTLQEDAEMIRIYKGKMFIAILNKVESALLNSQVWQTLDNIQQTEVIHLIREIDAQEEKRIKEGFEKQRIKEEQFKPKVKKHERNKQK